MALQIALFLFSCLSFIVSFLSSIFIIRKRCCIKYEFYVLLNLILSDLISPAMFILLCFSPIVDFLGLAGIRATTSIFITFNLLSAINENVVGLKRYLKIKKPLTFCKTYFKKRMIFITLAPWFMVFGIIVGLVITGRNGIISTKRSGQLLTSPVETLLYVRTLETPLLILIIALHMLFFSTLAYSHLTIWNTARYHKRSYKLTVKGVNSTKGSVKVLHLYKARRKVILILGSQLLAFLPYIILEFLIACRLGLDFFLNTDYMPILCLIAQLTILCRGLFNSFNYVIMDVARKECSMKQFLTLFATKSKCERTSSSRYYLSPENPEQPRRSSQQSILTEASYV